MPREPCYNPAMALLRHSLIAAASASATYLLLPPRAADLAGGRTNPDGDTGGAESPRLVTVLRDVRPPLTPADRLANLITATVSRDSWAYNGGDCSIGHFGGWLIVRATPETQAEVDSLLLDLTR